MQAMCRRRRTQNTCETMLKRKGGWGEGWRVETINTYYCVKEYGGEGEREAGKEERGGRVKATGVDGISISRRRSGKLRQK